LNLGKQGRCGAKDQQKHNKSFHKAAPYIDFSLREEVEILGLSGNVKPKVRGCRTTYFITVRPESVKNFPWFDFFYRFLTVGQAAVRRRTR
jgi:hypothetical protein